MLKMFKRNSLEILNQNDQVFRFKLFYNNLKFKHLKCIILFYVGKIAFINMDINTVIIIIE